MNETRQTTIIFTTHDMQDIEKVCQRLIIIDAGKKVYDGSIQGIKDKYASIKNIELLMEDGRKEVRTFDTNEQPMNQIMSAIFADSQVKDISICEPDIDEIIRDIYEGNGRLDSEEGGF